MKTKSKLVRCVGCGELVTEPRNVLIQRADGLELRRHGPVCRDCCEALTKTIREAEEMWMAKTYGA